MNCTTVSTAGYINIISIKVTDYTAHIANNCFFCPCISRTYLFFYKTIFITCAGSHNIAAIVNTVSNSIMRSIFISAITFSTTKIPCYTANIMRAAHFVFSVSCVGNISINSTANNTANITGVIVVIISTLTAAYIAGI